MTSMRHQVNVRTNASESDRGQDKEREKESPRHLNRQFGNFENKNYENANASPQQGVTSKIHALKRNCPPRSAVTWRFSKFLLHGHIQAVAQDPQLNRHLDPGNCPSRPAVTWRFVNFLLHDHTKTRVQWVFSFPRTNYTLNFALAPT